MRLAPLAFALLPLALAGCDDKTLAALKLPGLGKPAAATAAAPATAPAAPAAAPAPAPQPPAVSPLEVPIEVADGADRALGTANAETVNVTAFEARGNEPFWSVAVEGSTATLKRAGAKDAKITVKRINFGDGVEYAGVLGGAPFSLGIRATDCTDSMSGAAWPMTATVRWSGSAHPGCAAPKGAAPKGAPTETAARPAPAPAG